MASFQNWIVDHFFEALRSARYSSLKAASSLGKDPRFFVTFLRLACRLSTRRPKTTASSHASPLAAEALSRLGQLYGSESEIRGRSPDQRREIRQVRSRPLLESLHDWLRTCFGKLPKKSTVTSAINYALGRWSALLRFCDDGRLEIDNNAAERALRAVALGRNYVRPVIMCSPRELKAA